VRCRPPRPSWSMIAARGSRPRAAEPAEPARSGPAASVPLVTGASALCRHRDSARTRSPPLRPASLRSERGSADVVCPPVLPESTTARRTG
jgi:hypothetical protein